MADTRISQLTASGTIADGDLLPIVDVSDTTDSADGTTRKITKANLTTDLAPKASPTFTGTVTIPTPFTLGATSVLPTGTELNYVDGVTSAIQAQIDAKAPSASPTLTTPNIGVATATSVNKVAITAPTTSATLTIADGATLTVSGSATVTNGTHSGTNTGDNTVATALTGTPSITVATVTTTGNIELGHATATTLSGSGGVLSVEGSAVLTAAGGTLTGNITLGENTSIALDPAGSADGKYTGITVTGTGGTTIAFGDLIYLAAVDSRWELTDANAVGTAGPLLIGMAVATWISPATDPT